MNPKTKQTLCRAFKYHLADGGDKDDSFHEMQGYLDALYDFGLISENDFYLARCDLYKSICRA